MKTQKIQNGKGMPTMTIPVAGQRRATLNRIRSRAKKFGFKDSDVRPQRLRLYAKLENNKSNLMFKVAVETQSHAAEIRLEKSDAFYADQLGLAIHKVLLSGGIEIPANSPLIHYPDANWLTETNEARDCEGLYNSLLSIKTDQDVRLENFDTSQLRYVPRQQYQPSATDPLTWQTSKEALYELEANIGLWGNKRNEIEIKFGSGIFAAVAGDPADATDPHQNYAVILLDGFLLVRGAESVTVSDANLIFQGM